jgi:prolyl-tRNA synthetase
MWPESVSPFRVHVLALQNSVLKDAEEFIKSLPDNVDVLFDDRDLSPGQKLSESDLLGITTKIVISEKNKQQQKVEVINRTTGERKLVDPAEAVKELSV